MKQSPHDPTLKEHFGETEARQWIRHLERIIEMLERKLARSGEKNRYLVEKSTFRNRQNKRLKIHIQSLEDQIEALTGVRPLPIDTSNVFIPTQEEE